MAGPPDAKLNHANPFLPRFQRYGLDLPIQFVSPEETARGHCVDVSESGMLGAFDQHLNVWTSGELRASLGDESVSIGARVARVDGLRAGLSFQIRNEKDRLAVSMLIDFALRCSSRFR